MENETEVLEQSKPLPEKDVNANKQLFVLNLNHLSIILSNVAFFASITTFALALSGIVTIFAMFIMVMLLFAFLMFATICTLGIIYVLTGAGKMWTWFDKISEQGLAITNFIYKILPFVSTWAFVSCVIALLALSFMNKERKLGRIITTSIFAVLTLVIAVFSLAGVFKWIS